MKIPFKNGQFVEGPFVIRLCPLAETATGFRMREDGDNPEKLFKSDPYSVRTFRCDAFSVRACDIVGCVGSCHIITESRRPPRLPSHVVDCKPTDETVRDWGIYRQLVELSKTYDVAEAMDSDEIESGASIDVFNLDVKDEVREGFIWRWPAGFQYWVETNHPEWAEHSKYPARHKSTYVLTWHYKEYFVVAKNNILKVSAVHS